MRDRFGIFGVVIRNRKLSLLLVMTFRMPNKELAKLSAAMATTLVPSESRESGRALGECGVAWHP